MEYTEIRSPYALLQRCLLPGSLKTLWVGFPKEIYDSSYSDCLCEYLEPPFDVSITGCFDTAFISFEIALKGRVYFEKVIRMISNYIKPSGHLIAFVPNKFGAKYICGTVDPVSKISFDGFAPAHSFRYDKYELNELFKEAGYKHIKYFYPFPDYDNPSLVYTDEYKAGAEIAEKLFPAVTDTGSRVMQEREFIIVAAKAGNAEFFANTFVVECSCGSCSKLIYSCITDSRRDDRAFVTSIFSDNTVRKMPLYEAGKESIKKMASYTKELSAHGVPVVNLKNDNGTGVMERIFAPTLSDHIRNNIKSKEELLYYTDKLNQYIMMSSEHSDNVCDYFKNVSPEKMGAILKRAYFEMIPVNCFVKDDDLLFFDQEYAIDNCPASFIMFRCINDIFRFIPEIKSLISQDEMIKKYGLTGLWKDYLKIEQEIFRDGYCDDNKTTSYIPDDIDQIKRNRNLLKMNADIKRELYDMFSGMDDEKIILFGSGKYCDYYLDKYEKIHPPVFIIDNNKEKHGTFKRGFEIRSPEAVKELLYGTYRVIIAVSQFAPIADQLESMGITAAAYRIFNKTIDAHFNDSITDTLTEGKYNIGYIPGAFDLFHIGHLNILRRSKERCHYLIAGVLTDEIIREEKGKEPFIPFEERFEIVKQCKFVDRAIAVDKHNTDKFDAFRELHFGCMFSGSDHGEGYYGLRDQLRVLGSNVEIFPYTESTSSTMLQKLIKDCIESGNKK